MHDTIPAWFHHTAATAPPENGIVFEGVRHGYPELERLAAGLAAWFASRGHGRGGVVAILLPNRMEIPLTHLAMMELGGVTLPLNTAYTGEELAFILADAGAKPGAAALLALAETVDAGVQELLMMRGER